MPGRALKVLIAGGGIGGITAALTLRRHGIEAALFEQAEAFRQVGAGIQISSNAVRVLRGLELSETLARVAVYPEARDYRAWDTGERLFWTPLGARAEAHFGAPYYHVHRADLLDVLLSGLGDADVHLNARVESFDQDANGVAVTRRPHLCRRRAHRRRRHPFAGAGPPVWRGTSALYRQRRLARTPPGRARGAS